MAKGDVFFVGQRVIVAGKRGMSFGWMTMMDAYVGEIGVIIDDDPAEKNPNDKAYSIAFDNISPSNPGYVWLNAWIDLASIYVTVHGGVAHGNIILADELSNGVDSSKPATPVKPARDFDGFCGACDGLHFHKLGCPRKGQA